MLKLLSHGATRAISTLMEKPCVLAAALGDSGGIYARFAPLLEEHFTLVAMETLTPAQAERVQAVLVWGGAGPVVDRALLARLPRLRVVVNGGVGVDHLDLPLLGGAGLLVCNTPGVVDNATADLGLALLLASARRIVPGHQFSLSRETDVLPESSLGTEVSGATLGIVGMGRIGYKVAQRAKAFNMQILYHNRTRRPEEEERAICASFCPQLEELLQQSDFVMLVVNLSPQTHKLIGAEQLAMMKPTATLINISRGQVVDQEALVEALQRKVISAAALDVTYPEPLPRDHPLAVLPNVVILPHMGTHTLQTTRAMVERMVLNARAALAGDTPPDQVKG